MIRGTILIVSGLGWAGCQGSGGLPDPGSAEYIEVASSFHTGVAAVQVGESRIAEAAFERAGELAPGEGAIWANLALVSLQQRELDTAAARVERARELGPAHGRVELLAGVLARERGMPEKARAHLLRAADLEPENLHALYLLARLAAEEEGVVEARRWVDRILEVRGENRAALLERARLAASAGDHRELLASVDRLEALSVGSEVGRHLRATRAAAESGSYRRAGAELSMVHMELQRLPEFLEDERALVLSPSRTDLLLTRFLALPTPSAEPDPPDTGLAFERQAFSIGRSSWASVRAVWLSDQAPTALTALTPEAVWIQSGPEALEPFPFPGGGNAAPDRSAMAPLDYDYDFRVDLALAGGGGFRLLRQDEGGAFVDVTAGSVPVQVAQGEYAGTWSADLDMEGDLDLVLARVAGPPLLLRNRGDGGFERSDGFSGVTGVRDFVWADLDADGDPDATLLDAEGRLHIFANERYRDPQFVRMAATPELGTVRAIAAADLNRDAIFDLVVLAGDGTLRRLALRAGEWRAELVGEWPGMPRSDPRLPGARLLVADLDNNGGLDLVASAGHAARVWLSSADSLRAQAELDLGVTDVADLTDDGRLDLIGLAADGTPLVLINRGTLEYYSATLRPRAARATGDRRINPFGVGGEIEVRSGLLYQKQLIGGPTAHFGLGGRARIDVARIIWPNGSVQAEFDLPATREPLLARQRLKGSCPWLFAFDGEEMRFVTDFIWRTALGLRINMQGSSAVVHSEDWIRIRGDQLAARDGFYDLRITAELWETYYFDHIALLTVDHPEGTEVFVDERFVLPAPEPALHAMAPPRPVARALDQDGRDVTELIRARDERYLDTFELGPYQGIAEDHYVEVELGDDVPTSGSLWLVATGWVYPTDSSINIAVDQGEHAPLRGLQLEVPDGRGGWSVVNPDLGFPAGKAKTILIDLRGVFGPGTPPRLRLRTNMEVYWDRIAWSVDAPESTLRTERLLPSTASLRYRGFSPVRQASRTAPELPDYEIAGTAPRWRDLIGFYTRFGDVRPLNESVDDRYTIMNAGDELVLQFPAPPPPPDGWTRDFVLIGDGWIKDGDLNTGFSKTVAPLPYHGLADYDREPGQLENEPAYRRHPEDWRLFHTRYVTPQDFHHALAPERDD
jgi:Tfp pilus assembly protein PilF